MTDNVPDEPREEIVSQQVDNLDRERPEVDERDLPPVDDDTLDRLDEPT